MLQQDLPELTAYARSLLRKYSNRNEAISHFCETTHMEWNEAEALMRRVEATYSQEIQRYRTQGTGTETTKSRLVPMIIIACAILLFVAIWAVVLFGS